MNDNTTEHQFETDEFTGFGIRGDPANTEFKKSTSSAEVMINNEEMDRVDELEKAHVEQQRHKKNRSIEDRRKKSEKYRLTKTSIQTCHHMAILL